MNNILNQICIYKKELVEAQRKKITEKDLQIIIDDSEEPRAFKKKIAGVWWVTVIRAARLI